jgi:hypothetical protein
MGSTAVHLLTLNQAVTRWAPPVPGRGGLTGPALLDAVFAGAEADRYTGLITGAPELSGSDGVVEAGQTVFEYHNGVCTDRWVTLRAEPGTLVWVVMGPGADLDPAHPEGTFPSIEAAMENVKDRDGRPLDWAQPYPDGIYRAGSARTGRWLMFPSIVHSG